MKYESKKSERVGVDELNVRDKLHDPNPRVESRMCDGQGVTGG